jgi:hypothetical protein
VLPLEKGVEAINIVKQGKKFGKVILKP